MDITEVKEFFIITEDFPSMFVRDERRAFQFGKLFVALFEDKAVDTYMIVGPESCPFKEQEDLVQAEGEIAVQKIKLHAVE